MADQGSNSATVIREYRKGNWTLSETMVLIEAKKMADERRMKRSSGGDSSEARSKPAELRWKWVEDYCWRKSCMRSQNQCNDKWDNLMRDYKKVRDYERKISEKPGDVISYWNMEKNDRKEKNLPSNMLLQIYEALVEVVEKKGAGQRVSAGGGGGGGGDGSAGSNPNLGRVVERPISVVQPPAAAVASSLPSVLQHHQHQLSSPNPVLPLPLDPPSSQQSPSQSQPQHPPPPPPFALPYTQPAAPPICDSSDSDTNEHSDSLPAKRRRRGGGTTGGTASASTSQELGTAISKSASIIAEALQACEEREEKRHRDLVSLHERRLEIEESKSEINKQGINGLVDAIKKLANSVHALAGNNKNQQSAPKS